jgi:hypothetical protein
MALYFTGDKFFNQRGLFCHFFLFVQGNQSFVILL